MHLDAANIKNLTDLWKMYGAMPIHHKETVGCLVNTHWPHRCWLPGPLPRTATWLDDVPARAIVSIWDPATHTVLETPLQQAQWICAFEQTAMGLALPEEPQGESEVSASIQVVPVTTAEDVREWVSIGSEAFAYFIDQPVIEGLLNKEDVRILLAMESNQAVACALLYKTDDVIGIHQVAVRPDCQGKGIAKQLLKTLIAIGQQWQGRWMVLQASDAGIPLYESVGFERQFVIKNYRKRDVIA